MARVEKKLLDSQGNLIKAPKFQGVEKIDKLDDDKKEAKKDSLGKFNYPKSLGVSVRIKDIALAIVTSLGCGWSAFHCASDARLFLHVFPFQMFLISGIAISYLKKAKYTLKMSTIAALLSTGVTIVISLYLNSKLEKLSLVFRPMGWLIEHVGTRILTSKMLGVQIGPITDTDFVNQAQRVHRWVRGAVSMGVTLISGSLVGCGINIFRIATNKKWL